MLQLPEVVNGNQSWIEQYVVTSESEPGRDSAARPHTRGLAFPQHSVQEATVSSAFQLYLLLTQDRASHRHPRTRRRLQD